MSRRISRGTISADPNPIRVEKTYSLGKATITWASEGAEQLEVRVGAPDGELFAHSGPAGTATTGPWIQDGTTFYLQDVSDGLELTAANTLAILSVRVERPPSRFDRHSNGNAFTPIPPVGSVRFGDLRRLTPLSYSWGSERGHPIDRYYIEAFLDRHRNDVRGRVISVGQNNYATQFGGDRIVRSDVLDIDETNMQATIVADLCDAAQIQDDSFDCFICPQTLQFIYDVRAAVRTIHRVLQPGGVALVTLPAVTQTYDANWGDYWCWSFAPHSVARLFHEFFSPEDVEITPHGNPLVAVAFLMGLADRELDQHELDYLEPGYEIVITVRAVKSRNRR